MSKEIYISSTPHETRLAIVENDALTEIYYERENEYTLAGSIYNGKVTRVLPGMQSSFVDIGLERDAFLYITDFMEEAGDSADFDTNGHGDSRRRSSAPTIEGTLAAEPAVDAGNRSDRNDRGGRGDRSRNRGRRDRNGNRERQPQSDLAAPSVSHESQESQETPEFDRPIDFAPENSANYTPTTDRPDENVPGEGAPGADGSRRWRGRRGRRRGRGPGQRDESTQAASQIPEAQGPGASASEAAGQPSYTEEFESESESETSFEIDGAAEPRPNTAPIASAYPSAEMAPQEDASQHTRGDQSERNNRGDRNNRRGRDRNDRNRGRNDRGGRNDRAPRVPRGFAPKTSLYGVDDAPAYNESPEAAVEPIVLPGESLSKYRKASAPQSTSTPKPADANVIIPAAPEFTIPTGWDGGATLPGESLSRHRRPENLADRRSPYRQDIRTDHPGNPEPQSHAQATPNVPALSAAEPVEPKPEALQAPQPPAASAEYEPTDASASYRVDPAAPSEFRQTASVLEAPEAQVSEPEVQAPETSEAEPSHTLAHSITPGPEDHAAPLHTELAHTQPQAAIEKFDWQTPEPSTPVPASTPNPASTIPPVVSDTTPHDVTTLHATGDITSEAPAATFIPPAGALVEETLDEEDYNTTLHASSIEEMEDFDEEETLEGAADLGTMIREMSIDQITHSGHVDDEDEDEDFEEEDTLHDPTHDDLDDAGEEDEEDLDESDIEEDVLHEEFVEGSEVPSNGFNHAESGAAAPAPARDRTGDRGRGRRDGRRDGRRGSFGRGDRNDRADRSDRPRHTGGAADRERSGGRDRRGGRSSMQSTNLPAISELLKPGQEILVQIAKEPIAKKGARITSHIALPGRFLVFMPTVNHTGVSRKIESDEERQRLKRNPAQRKGRCRRRLHRPHRSRRSQRRRASRRHALPAQPLGRHQAARRVQQSRRPSSITISTWSSASCATRSPTTSPPSGSTTKTSTSASCASCSASSPR